jgi:hypothetical protein
VILQITAQKPHSYRAEATTRLPSASYTCSGDTSMVTVVKGLENPESD